MVTGSRSERKFQIFNFKILRLRFIVQRKKNFFHLRFLSLRGKRFIRIHGESLCEGKEQICNRLKVSSKST